MSVRPHHSDTVPGAALHFTRVLQFIEYAGSSRRRPREDGVRMYGRQVAERRARDAASTTVSSAIDYAAGEDHRRCGRESAPDRPATPIMALQHSLPLVVFRTIDFRRLRPPGRLTGGRPSPRPQISCSTRLYNQKTTSSTKQHPSRDTVLYSYATVSARENVGIGPRHSDTDNFRSAYSSDRSGRTSREWPCTSSSFRDSWPNAAGR